MPYTHSFEVSSLEINMDHANGAMFGQPDEMAGVENLGESAGHCAGVTQRALEAHQMPASKLDPPEQTLIPAYETLYELSYGIAEDQKQELSAPQESVTAPDPVYVPLYEPMYGEEVFGMPSQVSNQPH